VIPRVVHFVHGLREQTEPFHVLHSIAIESARRYVAPEAIHFHYKVLPWGPYFDRVSSYLTLHEVDLVEEVLDADPEPVVDVERYRHAIHADFIGLDALIEHGGIYADIDTIFVAEFPDALFEAPFVIGQEAPVHDERTGELRRPLGNALLMSEPGSEFARVWRAHMASSLDGTWSSHRGSRPERLVLDFSGKVRVEPEESFYSFSSTPAGLAALLERETPVPAGALSVHLWAHLWWERGRTDFSRVHGGRLTAHQLARSRTTLGSLVRPFLPATGVPRTELGRWRYVSLDEETGYAISANQRREAFEEALVDLDWMPLLPGGPLDYGPAPNLGDKAPADVVVAHTYPELLESIRDENPGAFLVAQTVWETDRLPDQWPACLERADLIVTPTRSSAEVLATGSNTPVAVVPYALTDPEEGPSRAWDWIPPEVTVFYTIAAWTARKAVDRTIEAYVRAFDGDDPVLLIVKTSYWDQTFRRRDRQPADAGTAAWSLAGVVAERSNPPAIALDVRRVGDVDIEALHRLGDCFVSLTRGEGWGRGAFDAATHGNPVVTTAYGGHLDFLGGSPGLVDFRMVRVDNPRSTRHSPEQRWAEADVDHAAKLLRSVVTDPIHRSWAANRALEIRSRYGRQPLAETYIEAVQTYRRHQRTPQPVTTGIRWLSPGPGSEYGDWAETTIAGLRSAAIPVTWSRLGWATNEWDGNYDPIVAPGPSGSSQDDIVGLPIEDDTLIVHSPPVWNEWLEAEQGGRRMVASTTWTHDRLSEGQVQMLNRYDLVVVPSRFNVQTFMASGVTVPVAAVPPIVRPLGVLPVPPATGGLRFYTIATWHTRKGLADTITAYLDAFGPEDDVSLLVCAPEADQVSLAQTSPLGWAIDRSEGLSSVTLDRLIWGARRSRADRISDRTDDARPDCRAAPELALFRLSHPGRGLGQGHVRCSRSRQSGSGHRMGRFMRLSPRRLPVPGRVRPDTERRRNQGRDITGSRPVGEGPNHPRFSAAPLGPRAAGGRLGRYGGPCPGHPDTL
jgi:hypothetical protein